MLNKLVVLGTGGTIAGASLQAADNVGYRAAQVGIGELLQSIPGMQDVLNGHGLVSEQVVQVDSKDMGYGQWRALAQRVQHHLEQADVAAVVITHGTDTLEETAFFLSKVLPAPLLGAKPVVLTCAMRPASALAPDGPQNMRDAVTVALDDTACGVLVVCAGAIHGARDVQKVHPYRVDAFASGEAGPLGLVEERVVRWLHACPRPQDDGVPLAAEQWLASAWPRVELVTSHAGADGWMVRALCTPMAGVDPVRGIVVATTGNGTIHADLDAALQDAQALGVRVVRSTRCSQGHIVQGTSTASGFPCAQASSPVKARIELVLDLLRERKG